MNRVFQVTTATKEHGVVLSYNAQTGFFVGIALNEHFTSEELHRMLPPPYTVDEFIARYGGYKGATVVELNMEVSFDMMWKRHNDFYRSSKKEALKYWNRMPKTEQVKAFYYHPTYMKNKGNAEKKHLITYLKDELWNN